MGWGGVCFGPSPVWLALALQPGAMGAAGEGRKGDLGTLRPGSFPLLWGHCGHSLAARSSPSQDKHRCHGHPPHTHTLCSGRSTGSGLEVGGPRLGFPHSQPILLCPGPVGAQRRQARPPPYPSWPRLPQGCFHRPEVQPHTMVLSLLGRQPGAWWGGPLVCRGHFLPVWNPQDRHSFSGRT